MVYKPSYHLGVPSCSMETCSCYTESPHLELVLLKGVDFRKLTEKLGGCYRISHDGREVGWIWMDHNRFWNEDFQFFPQMWYYTIFNG